jgi:7,8-dihydropterin-6-yl-methyl-4-(beta-D-ribofuranosyl)aminobenzene 5'-phosphate synthase
MTNYVEHVEVVTITENYVDMLALDSPGVTRLGLVHHFDPRRIPPQAENGISFLVRTLRSGKRRTVLFDTGLTGSVITHNLAALQIDPNEIEGIVISHGHPDHYGGLIGLLTELAAPTPVYIHPAAFSPRFVRLPTGEIAPHYNGGLTVAAIEGAGGRVVLHEGPLEVIDGVYATGAIARQTDFERGPDPQFHDPGLFHVRNGQLVGDAVPDDQALVICVDDVGLVVLTGCSHAGVMNSIGSAQACTGVRSVHAVMGGFHLGFPGTPESKTDRTVEALAQLDPMIVAPMHCSGFRAIGVFAGAFGDRFLLNFTGTTVEFGARGRGRGT